MITNPELKDLPTALFSCSNDYCREEVSYPAADLFWNIDEKRWICDNCWPYQNFNEEKKIPSRGISLKTWLLAHNFAIKELL